MQMIIDERAADPDMQDVPGGKSGLMVRTYKGIGAGPTAQCYEEYAADTPLSAEMRATEKQAAQEVGQWVEKSDMTSDGKALVVKVLRGVSADDL